MSSSWGFQYLYFELLSLDIHNISGLTLTEILLPSVGL